MTNTTDHTLTQNEMILNHLKHVGSITSMMAIDRYGVTRLSARIYELRNEGYDIQSRSKTKKNRYGMTVRFDEYFLEENKQ